jgi:hypothetical protein
MTETAEERLAFRTFARSGYDEMTSRPAASTPPVTGDSCTPPDAREVTKII